MADLRGEVREVLKLQRAELRELIDEHPDMPAMIRHDLSHLCTQLTICIDHLAPSISDALLARGTVE